MSAPQVSVVFPAYNEGPALDGAVAAAFAYLDARPWSAEVLIVDDGSRDDTLQRAQSLAAGEPRLRVLTHTPNRGKGFAVREGMLAARGEFRFFLDVDLATPLETFDLAMPLLQAGADCVLGSRHRPDARIEVPQSFLRRSMGGVFRQLANHLLRLRVTDITCGFKAYRAAAAHDLFTVMREFGWAYDAELIYIARRWDLRIEEVPVHWRDAGRSSVRPLRAAWNSLQEIRRIPRHDRAGAYRRPAGDAP
jgi:glycosyltransferase involved in cell wall biosynthesis